MFMNLKWTQIQYIQWPSQQGGSWYPEPKIYREVWKKSINSETEEWGEGNFPAGIKTCYYIIEIKMLEFDARIKK